MAVVFVVFVTFPNVSWSTLELRARLALCNRFKPSSKIVLLSVPRRYFFCGSFMFFLSNVCLSVSCALWSPAGEGLTSWLSFVVSNCKFVTFSLVSIPDLCTLTYFESPI